MNGDEYKNASIWSCHEPSLYPHSNTYLLIFPRADNYDSQKNVSLLRTKNSSSSLLESKTATVVIKVEK